MSDLFRIRGFLPYVVMLFLNAFVDLGHKITIQNTIFKTYDGNTLIILTAIVNALILLPYILLYTPTGFLADKFPKNKVMRISAWAAVALTGMITLFYHLGWFWAAFAMTFLLAIQSAFYSPAKYGYIREIAGKERLARANGVVQATTTIAILTGTFVFSITFEMFLADVAFSTKQDVLHAIKLTGWFLIAGSLVELLLAYRLPNVHEPDENLRFDWVKYRTGQYLSGNLRAVISREVIFLSIIGVAIFWAIGQVLLAAFPAFAKDNLDIYDTRIIQGMLACAGIGIMLGSLIAGRISKNYIETGLIPVGALGVATCLFIMPGLASVPAHGLNILMLGMLGGLFIIPLNALIQFHAGENILGRVLAGNNFIKNIMMLGFLVLTVLFSMLEISNMLFTLLTVVALAGAFYTVYKLPQSLVRLIVTLAIGYRYRLVVQGFNHFPDTGGVLMLGQQANLKDWTFIQMAAPRQIRFVMDENIRRKWYARKFFEFFGTITGAPDQSTRKTVTGLLNAGEVVCPWFTANPDSAEWLENIQNDSDKTVEWAILPYSLSGSPGSRPSGETIPGAGANDVTIIFGEPR